MRENKRGRPLNKQFEDKDLINEIRNLSAQGLTQEQICRVLKIKEGTWEVKSEYIEDLARVYEDGKALGAHWAGKALLEKVVEGDIAAIKWYETSRNYRKSDNNTTEIKLSMSDEAVASRIAELEGKLKDLE